MKFGILPTQATHFEHITQPDGKYSVSPAISCQRKFVFHSKILPFFSVLIKGKQFKGQISAIIGCSVKGDFTLLSCVNS